MSKDYRSIARMFDDRASANARKVAYRSKKGGSWETVSWADACQTVRQIARTLIALGIKRGDRVAILGQTRLEWVLSDFGAVYCGGVTVGIYPSNLAQDCAYILNHAEAKVLFVDGDEQLQKILSVRGQLPHLEQLVTWTGRDDEAHGVMSWSTFLARHAETPESILVERSGELGPDDVASIVYTSGTTGIPKGVMLTHKNLLFVAWSAGQVIYTEPHFETLLFLPLAHVFARLIAYLCMGESLTLAFAQDMTTIPENLKEIRPHFIACVPRIYDKVHDRVCATAEQAGGLKKTIFDRSLAVGLEVSRRKQEGLPIGTWLSMKYALADKLVFHKIREAFGGRLVFGISGAAPLNPDVAVFFHACGVLILEGIGMTENTSFSNVNRIDHNKFGTVGPAGPGVEVKIADDGEVLFRGDNVMKGYFKNPEATAETIDAEGWLKSGDIGELDDDGFLKITDRKKDLIVTAGGKNVAPQRIELILQTSRYITHAMAYGDRRKFISALVTLELDSVRAWAVAHGLSARSADELAAAPEVHKLIESEIKERNQQLASFESVKRFVVLPIEFSVEGGELTPSLKLRRKVVTERYQEKLDALYGG